MYSQYEVFASYTYRQAQIKHLHISKQQLIAFGENMSHV